MDPGQLKTPAVAVSIEDMKRANDEYHLNLSDADLAEYAPLMEGCTASLRRVLELPEPVLPVKYQRLPGYQPGDEENEYRAWTWKTEIVGREDGPLKGARVAVKDNICVASAPLANGSHLLQYVPTEDATIVTRLLDAGCVLAGKAACEDLCLSGGSFTSANGPVRNPLNPTLQAFGSSCGSAVLVAAGEVAMAVAGDQGGSIRLPSAACGVVGMKPTHGLVPYTGAYGMVAGFDTLGPVTRGVPENARYLDVMAGKDGLDVRQGGAPAYPVSAAYSTALGNTAEEVYEHVRGLRVGVLQEGFGVGGPDGLADGVDDLVRAAVLKLGDKGAVVEEVSVPLHKDGPHIWTAIAVEQLMMTSYMSGGQVTGMQGHHCVSSLMQAASRGMQTPAGTNSLSVTNKLFIMLGSTVLRKYGGAFAGRAGNQARALRDAYDSALEHCDVLVMPTSPIRPGPLPPAGASPAEQIKCALSNIANTAPFNCSGHPAITVPVCADHNGGVGLMVVGRHWDERTVYRVAHAVQLLLEK
mmetsp:Transcript_20057/g.56364  ORF Transcript_20057/g.56364 Transcript_20057/m.56364 type:complete len:526 (+) Transcript_20057:80-1657(+)